MPKLISDTEMINDALKEAGLILITAYIMLDASGKATAEIEKQGQKVPNHI